MQFRKPRQHKYTYIHLPVLAFAKSGMRRKCQKTMKELMSYFFLSDYNQGNTRNIMGTFSPTFAG